MAWLGTKKGLIVLFLVIFVAMFGIGAVVGEKYKSLFSDSIESKDIKGQAFNILFMGIDDRDNANNSRSDTMILATIDPKTSRVALLSIPRDTRIKNSKGRNEKINGVNYIEGPEAACKAVGELLDTDVEYYVTTNFEGFGKIVDILGGVDINVESDMKHWDVSYAIDLKKGLHHMNGDQALQYVRYRGGPTADIGRTQRQQQFIKALADEMFKAKTILKLPSLIPEINKYVKTNIPLTDMVYMAGMAKKFDSSGITAQTLPGYSFTDPSTGASYWEADREKAGVIIETLLQGKTLEVFSDPPKSSKSTRYVAPVAPATANTKVTEPEEENTGQDEQSGPEPAGTDKEPDTGLGKNPADIQENSSGPEPLVPGNDAAQTNNSTHTGPNINPVVNPAPDSQAAGQ